MKKRSITLMMAVVLAMSFLSSTIFAQSAGDFVAIADGDYNTLATWGISDGEGGTSAATVLPTTSNNVWIPEGRAITNITSTANAKDLNLAGSLVSGVNTTSTKDVTVNGNLFIASTGVLKSTSANAGSVGTLRVGGSLSSGPCTIQVEGQLGSASLTDVAGSGFRLYCEAGGITTVQGNGKFNLARFQSGNNNGRNQTIVIDMDVNLQNSVNNGKTLSLENGNAGTATKTLIVNEGRTVRFIDNNTFALLGSQDSESMVQTTGNLTYDIRGTVNTGSKGGVKLTTSSQGASSAEVVTLKIGPVGKLIVGSRVITKVTQPTQSIVYDFEEGSTVEFASVDATTFSAPTVDDTQSFMTEFSNLIVNTAAGLTLPSSILVKDNLTLNNGMVVLGENNLTVDGAIVNADVDKYIVTNGDGVLIQSIPEETTVVFPVGVSVESYDPVVLTPLLATVCSVNVSDVLPAEPASNYSYNLRVWNVTPETPSSTAITLTPSSVTATGINDVIGRYADDVYTHVSASKSGNSYSATLSTFSPLVTGANDLGTSVDMQMGKSIVVRHSNDHIVVENTVEGQLISLYQMDGKLLKQFSSSQNVSFIPAKKGMYLLKVDHEIFKIIL